MLNFITAPLEILLNKYSTMDNNMKVITRGIAIAILIILLAFAFYLFSLSHCSLKEPKIVQQIVTKYKDTCISKIDTFVVKKGDVYNSTIKESSGPVHIGSNN